jgi:hypothetical protein
MGSQSKPNARGLTTNFNDRHGPGAKKNSEDFSDYICEMTPSGLGHERRAPPTSPHDREERYLAADREAMRFLSESNMR